MIKVIGNPITYIVGRWVVSASDSKATDTYRADGRIDETKPDAAPSR